MSYESLFVKCFYQYISARNPVISGWKISSQVIIVIPTCYITILDHDICLSQGRMFIVLLVLEAAGESKYVTYTLEVLY